MRRIQPLPQLSAALVLAVVASANGVAQTVPPRPETSQKLAGQRVHVILSAGHRNNSPKSSGAEGERSLTLRYADAYAARLAEEGFKVYYLQRMDDDNRPDWFSAGLDKLAVRATTVAQSLGAAGPVVMLDVHMEAPSAAGGVFAIVPDATGLAVPLEPPDDWKNNIRSRDLARLLAARISASTGIPVRSSKEKGVMSETQTGVAIANRARLAMFRHTAPVRARMERLVVEHGNLRRDAALLHAPATPSKVASAVAGGLRDFYHVYTRPETTTLTGTTTLPTSPTVGYVMPGILPPLDGLDHRVNGVEFVAARRRVTVTRDGIPALRYADPASAPVRRPLGAGEVLDVVFFVRGILFENDDRWWVTADGSRVPMAGTVEKLQNN